MTLAAALLALWTQVPPDPTQDQGIGLPPLPPPAPGRTPQILVRASVTTTVITGAEFESLGVRFLSDALRIAPGLEIQRLSSTESNVTLRGYNDDSSAAQGILALVDGRQANNEFFGSVVWETIPVSLDEIKQVEIIRGPGSFLYGPNAMHGLVNIVTKSPLDYEGDLLAFHGAAGTYGSNVESLIYVRRHGHAAVKVKAVHDDIDEFDPRGDNAKDKVFFEARFEADLEVGPGRSGHAVDVAAGVSEQKFNVLIPTFAGLPTASFSNSAQETYVRASHSFHGLKSQATWTRFVAAAEPDGVFSPFELFLDAADLDLQYTLEPMGRHHLTTGAGLRYASFETRKPDVADGDHSTLLKWYFAQDEFEILDHVWLTGGVRGDDHSHAGTRTSPRLALVWQFDPGDTQGKHEAFTTGQALRATSGYGFRNPSLRELWFDMPVLGGPAAIVGNDELNAERIRSTEVGYWGRPERWIQIEASAYYNLIDDLVDFVPVSAAPPIFAPANTRKEEAYGIETQVELQAMKELFVFGGHAYGLRYDRVTHDRVSAAPRHKASAGARLEPGAGFLVTAWASFFDDVRFIDPSTGALTGEVEEYFLLNARVSRRLELGELKGQVFVQAFNLLDHDHREHPQGDAYGLILTAGLDVRW